MNITEETSGVRHDNGVTLCFTGRQRAHIGKLFHHVENVLSGEALMLPSRTHPVVARAVVDIAIPDPVVALDFRVGYDGPTLALIGKRIARARTLVASTSPLTDQDVDDLCAAFTFCRLYLEWACTNDRPQQFTVSVEDGMRALSGDGDGRGTAWLWLGLVINELNVEERDV